jgi:hypothetical protein
MVDELIDYAREHEIERVFFLAREGLVLREMYRLMSEVRADAVPPADYLCVSRIATSYAAMGEYYGLREIISAAQANARKSVRRLMAPLRFADDELRALAAACGVGDIDAPASYDVSPAFARLVGHPRVAERTREVAAEGRAALHRYLRGRGFFVSRRVAVVDVGWGAQIQENLVLGVTGEPDAPEVHGIYLGANRFAGERRAAGLRVHATLADETRYTWAAGATFDFVQLYEISTRAPHGTVLGYQDGEPLLAEAGTPQRDSEDLEDGRVSRMQRGMLDAARLYAQVNVMLGHDHAAMRRYIATLACRVNRFPHRDEAEFFLRFRNVSNFGVAETLQLGERQPWWRPMQMARAINRALWSEGVARLALGRPGQVVLAVLNAARIRRRLPAQKALPTGLQTRQVCAPAKPDVDAATIEPHAFETMMIGHWRHLMDDPGSSPQVGRRRPAVTWWDLAVMATSYRLARIYLRARDLPAVRNDLPSTWPFVQRALFARFGDGLLRLRRRWRRLRR